jgi:glycosyltransferase involved in cell wall biosynthesis
MDKVIYNIASYKRADTLIKTIESIYNQCDIINITLNDYKEIPLELYDKKINLFISDNDKGDAYKFYNLINSNGYYLTIDDDLIYDKNYTQYMIGKIEEYNRKLIITIHGRNFQSFPISSYYNREATVYHFRHEMVIDKKVQFGGTGVMGFHTELFKINMDYFQYANMADVWIGKYAKENDIQIICAKHGKDFVKQLSFDESIYTTDFNNDEKQTKLVNDCYNKTQISIIVPTYNNIEYIDECLHSIVESSKDYEYEILVGIDHCEKTLSYVKGKEFYGNIRFFYFEKNVGPYVIKNTLSKLSNCDILLFFDSDDIMCKTMVETIIRLQKNNDFVKPMSLDFKHGNNPYIMNLKPTNTYGEGVFSIKKELFLSMNGFEGWRCAADSDFMGRLYKNKRTFNYTPEIVFYRRVHPESLTQQSGTNMSSSMRAKYASVSKNRQDFGPLPKLSTENYYEFLKKIIKPIEGFDKKRGKTSKEKMMESLAKTKPFNLQKKDNKPDYDVINNLLNKKDVYHPSKNVKPVKENTPVNRNDLFEIKKGTLAEQNRDFFPQKRQRDDSRNPFSKKNNL